MNADSGTALVRINPLEHFALDPDTCMKALILGSGIRYLSLEMYEQARDIGLTLCQTQEPTLRDFVDAWRNVPALDEFTNAVAHCFLLDREHQAAAKSGGQ